MKSLWIACTSSPIGLTQDDEKPWLLAYAPLVTEARSNQTKDFVSVTAYADKKPFSVISEVLQTCLKKSRYSEKHVSKKMSSTP